MLNNRNDKKDFKSSRVEPFRTQKDIMAMQEYFLDTNNNLMFLIFEVGISTGRRIGDILSLRWNHFYYPNGRKREKLREIKEDKTDKFASPYLSDGLWKAIGIYLNRTGVNPADNDYNNYICTIVNGQYKGKVITQQGCLKAMKTAGERVGITYNIGNHSLRETFGYITFNMFPNDPYKLQILQKIYNHSDSNVTLSYIGMTDDHAKRFYDGIGDMLSSLLDGEEISLVQRATNMVTVDYDKLMNLIQTAMQWNTNEEDYTTQEFLDKLEEYRKNIQDLNVV